MWKIIILFVCIFHTNYVKSEFQSGRKSLSHGNFKQKNQAHNTDDRVEHLCFAGADNLQPHPSDCARYVQCDNGDVHIRQCNPGTAYSIPRKECDFINNVDCSGREGNEVASVLTEDKISCPAHASGLYPHPYDCAKFLQCGNGQTYTQDCGPGTAFDSVRLLCDHKDKVKCCATCAETQSTDDSTGNIYKQAATPQLVSTYNTQHEVVLHTADLLCLSGLTGFFPYPFDYKKFISCKNGHTDTMYCETGTAFSISKGHCEIFDESNENDYVLYSLSEAENFITCPSVADGPHLYPFNAELYVDCSESQLQVVSCYNGQVFSVAQHRCLPYAQVLKHQRVHLLSELESISNYHVSKTEFSYDYNRGSDATTLNKGSFNVVNINLSTPSPPLADVLRTPPSSPSNTMTSDKIICPPGATGNYPYPFDCTKFLVCTNGVTHVQNCSPGTAWSRELKTCDHKYKVDCSHGSSKSTYAENKPAAPPSSIASHTSNTRHENVLHTADILCLSGITGFFPYPFDYKKVISCRNGNTEMIYCETGKAFSISKGYCEVLDETNENDYVLYSLSEAENFITCPFVADGPHLYPFNAELYVDCSESQLKVVSCYNGQVFSVAQRRCLPYAQVLKHQRVHLLSELESISNYHVSKTEFSYDYNRGSDATTLNKGSFNVVNINLSTPSPPLADVLRTQPSSPSNTITSDKIICPPGATGNYPYPFDCTKFLVCTNGVTHVQNCSPGTAWSRELKTCDHKYKVDCSHSSSASTYAESTPAALPSSIASQTSKTRHEVLLLTADLLCLKDTRGFFPYPFDYKKFINCKNGRTEVTYCAPGKSFSISKGYCEVLDKMHENDRVLYDVSEAKNLFTCPSAIDGLHVYPFNAELYVDCSENQLKVVSCNNGQVFSVAQRRCLPHSQVLKHQRVHLLSELKSISNYHVSKTELSTDYNRGSDATTLNTGDFNIVNINQPSPSPPLADVLRTPSTVLNSPLWPSNTVASDDVNCPPGATGNYQHPFDCTKFLVCTNGGTHVQNCSPGSAWNRVLKTCDHKYNVDCTQSSSASTYAENKPAAPPSSIASHTSNTRHENVLHTADILCLSGITGFFPYPFDFKKVISCKNGDTEMIYCETGTAFSISKGYCEVLDETNENDYVLYNLSEAYSLLTCPSVADGPHLYPFNAELYVDCSESQLKVVSCYNGQVFSLAQRRCLPHAQVLKHQRVHLLSELQSISNYHVSKTEFSYDYNRGSDATTLNKGSFNIVNINLPTPSPPLADDLRTPPSSPSNTMTSDKIICPPGATGNYPYPFDCTKFLVCTNGVTHVQNCSPGTAWSRELKTCDHKYKVDCSQSSSKSTYAESKPAPLPSSVSSHTSNAQHDVVLLTADLLCLKDTTGFFPFPFDYNKFINCTNGYTEVTHCEPGKAFSISKGYCEVLNEMHENDHVLYHVFEVKNLFTCPSVADGLHLYPFNAELYVHCAQSQMKVVPCNNDQVFSATERSCLARAQVLKHQRVPLISELHTMSVSRVTDEDYNIQSTVYCPPGLTGTYPYPFGSSTYLKCVRGNLIRESCDYGQAFSLSNKICMLKTEMNLHDYLPHAKTIDGHEWSATDVEISHRSSNGINYLMCPPGLYGYYLHPFDSTKYIQCTGGAALAHKCVNGSVYSISHKECISRDQLEAYNRLEYVTTTNHQISYKPQGQYHGVRVPMPYPHSGTTIHKTVQWNNRKHATQYLKSDVFKYLKNNHEIIETVI